MSQLHSPGGSFRKKPSWRSRRSLDGQQLDSVSPIRNFFVRIGSTGRSAQPPPKPALFRSCSTSQLSASYVRGDDPADCLEVPAQVPQPAPTYLPNKTVSCDNIAAIAAPPTRRPNFPYAFLRSKLSVLPEENGGSVLPPRGRLTKASSEECFSTILEPPSFCETNTLGRRPKRVSESTQAYVSSTESGYDSDGKPMEEGKHDGDSGIVTTEGSDSGSLHGSEPSSEPCVEPNVESNKSNRILDGHRNDFLESQLVQARPCVINDDDDFCEQRLFWIDEPFLANVTINDSETTYVHVIEPQPFEQNGESMNGAEASHKTLIHVNDLFSTDDSPSDLPHTPLIPESMVIAPIMIHEGGSLEEEAVQEVKKEDNDSEQRVFIEVNVNLPQAAAAYIEVSEEDNKVNGNSLANRWLFGIQNLIILCFQVQKTGLYIKNPAMENSKPYSKYFSRESPFRNSCRRFSESPITTTREITPIPPARQRYKIYKIAKTSMDEDLGIQLGVVGDNSDSRHLVCHIDPDGVAFR